MSKLKNLEIIPGDKVYFLSFSDGKIASGIIRSIEINEDFRLNYRILIDGAKGLLVWERDVYKTREEVVVNHGELLKKRAAKEISYINQRLTKALAVLKD